MDQVSATGRPHVVILGGGFGGLNAARTLARAPVDVTVVDRANYHLFQPLLYQVATAALAPTDITAPIRFLLRKQKNTTVLLAEATGIDVAARTVFLDAERRPLPYDFLIVATGSRHSYFSHPEWEPLAPGLKSIEDATEIRRRFLLAFERAEATDDPAERAAWLTFVIVGGGPTGTELAGVLPEIAKKALHPDFRHIDTDALRVLLIEGGPRVLPAFPESLSETARRDLEKLGVTVRTSAIVTGIDHGSVSIGEERIVARTVFWAAGNAASPLGRDLGVPLDKAGRVLTEKDLSIPGHPEVFVVGDLTRYAIDDKNSVPWVAQGAIQQGTMAARNIIRSLENRPRESFRYFDKGNLAVIGRTKAIADLGWLRLAGRPAWWLWLLVHILFLAGFRNRFSVLLEWGYAYFTFQRGSRLITDPRKENARR